jgi:hypothetical protein
MKLTKNIIAFKNGFVNLPNNSQNNLELSMSVVSELMQFGYVLNQDAIKTLSLSNRDNIIEFHNDIIGYLKIMTGSTRNHKPFWNGFPQEVMDKSEVELWIHQIVYYISNGTYIPDEFTEQRPSAFEQPIYTVISKGDEKEFSNIFTKLVSVNQSLINDDMEIVEFFIKNNLELIFPQTIPFKENLCTLASLGLNVPIKTVTDVLRICVHLSGGDISLPKVPREFIKVSAWDNTKIENTERENFKFKKFNRKERKYILNLLEQTNCDVREFVLKDNRWIRLGEILHPGEYKNKYPKAFKMFDDIRNTKVRSWYGEVDNAFKLGLELGLTKLSERPGEFMRRLDSLVRNNDSNIVLESLKNISNNISNKVLFESYGHFENRDKAVTNRTVMVKGARKKTPLPDLEPLSTKLVSDIQTIIKDSVRNNFSKLEKLGKVYIDEELKKLPIPTNMRSMSSTLKPVMRGQRVPIGNKDTKVIRAFVHWFDERGDQDIDLTSTFIGLGKIKHIGWNGEHNCDLGCYSGDIRHRKGACAEYIDIDIKAALKQGYKYVVMDAKNYNGGTFLSVTDCVFGYMEREYPKANEIFVPKTLSNTVRLQNTSSSTIAAVIDLESLEYIFLDVDTTGIPVSSANFDKILEAIKPYTELPKFSVYDLLKLHVDVRGELVEQDDAELILNIDKFPSYVDIGLWMGV